MLLAVAALAMSCATNPVGTASARPLNCMDLIAAPNVPTASGAIALLPPPSPFGIAVTRDGRARQQLIATVEGLPLPTTLGQYTTYIAWAYTASMDSAVKLGVLTNGRNDLGVLSSMQFRIIITAERSAAVTRRTGMIVLRGTSPSMQLLAHRDLNAPLAPGLLPDGPGITMHHDMSGDRLDVRPEPSGAAGPARIRIGARDTVTLSAAPASLQIGERTIAAFAYGQRVPGPVLDVDQGTAAYVRLINALPTSTSVHWHGIRLDNAFDGTPGLTQTSVAAGTDFFYKLRFPDAGVFWYHPHVREDMQQGLGLFGNILVRPADPRYYNAVSREEMLVLSDVLLEKGNAVPFRQEHPTHTLMGRIGNVFLINGRADYTLNVNRGDVVRFYVTNASNARTYNLAIPAARMKLIAGDASKFEREEWVQSVVIGPSERYTIEAQFSLAGSAGITNSVQAVNHMIGAYWSQTDLMGVVRVNDAPTPAGTFGQLHANADVTRSLTPFRAQFSRPVDRELVLTMRGQNLSPSFAAMLSGANASVDWNDGMPMMNAMSTPNEITWVLRDPATGNENMDIDWQFRRGDVVKVKIVNDPASPHAMAHPIHLHGQRFLVLTRDGVTTTNLAWKDTAMIPAGQTVELLVEMSNPGKWMLHCHIAEHLSGGMMAAFTVQ